MSELAALLGKYNVATAPSPETELDVATGKLSLERINLLFKHMPVDLSYVDENGAEQTGYIPTSALDLPETIQTADAGIDKKLDAGTLSESSGEGVLQKQWRQAEVSVKSMEYRWELRLQHPQMRT